MGKTKKVTDIEKAKARAVKAEHKRAALATSSAKALRRIEAKRAKHLADVKVEAAMKAEKKAKKRVAEADKAAKKAAAAKRAAEKAIAKANQARIAADEAVDVARAKKAAVQTPEEMRRKNEKAARKVRAKEDALKDLASASTEKSASEAAN